MQKKIKLHLITLKSKAKEWILRNQFDKLFKALDFIQKQYIRPKQHYDMYSCNVPYHNEENGLWKFVNASRVNVGKFRFIACQEPKDEYAENFLEFIKENNIKLILCLKNQAKYFKKYAPISKDDVYFDEKPFIVDELFEFKNFKVRRISCIAWEDFSVLTKEQMHYLFEYLAVFNKEEQVIHCQAGIGRTGTYIMYKVLKELPQVDLDVFLDLLFDLRSCRQNLVFNEAQLSFLIHEFLPDVSVCNLSKSSSGNKLI